MSSEIFWIDCSVRCPPPELDAWKAAEKLYQDLQEWVVTKGFKVTDIKLLNAEQSKTEGAIYSGCFPVAQITWLNGPKHWPLDLLDGRSFGNFTFNHNGKRYYLEPANDFVLSFELLDRG